MCYFFHIQNEKVLYTKQPFRRGMDYAIVNAGMCLKVDDKNGNIDTLKFCVGNIEEKPCSLDKVSGLAKGKYVDIMISHPYTCCEVFPSTFKSSLMLTPYFHVNVTQRER